MVKVFKTNIKSPNIVREEQNKKYSSSLIEYLWINGQRIMLTNPYPGGNDSLILYEVPPNYTLFITNVQHFLFASYKAGGSSTYSSLWIKSGGNFLDISNLYSTEKNQDTTLEDSNNFSPPIRVYAGEEIKYEKALNGTGFDYAKVVVIGFLVQDSLFSNVNLSIFSGKDIIIGSEGQGSPVGGVV